MVFAGVSATFAQPRFVSDVFADTGYERPVIINDRLYFIGDDGTGGEVWSTDGTTRGTRMVEDIWRKPPINNGRGPLSFPQPSGLTQIGDRLMFRATDSDTRVGVWAADDTGAWFVNAERTELSAINFAVFGAFGLFSAFDNSAREDRLWLTNGTKERTHQLGNVEPAYAIPGAQVGDRFFFAGRERQNAGTPFQLWLTDGRARGTRQVGYEGTGALNRVVATGESLFFSTTDNRKKYEVFWVDLTNGGDARMISSYEALSGIVSTMRIRVRPWASVVCRARRGPWHGALGHRWLGERDRSLEGSSPRGWEFRRIPIHAVWRPTPVRGGGWGARY